MTAAAGRALGLFGKLPCHGDFVRRGLPVTFCDPWDAWIQRCLAKAQARLAARWDMAWRRAPALRFALDPGACGPAAAAGAMVASWDSVGRSLPLTVAALRPAVARPSWPRAWLAAAERLALSARDGGLDADGLFAAIAGAPDRSAAGPSVEAGWWISPEGEASARPWNVASSMPSPGDFVALLEEPA